MKSKTKRKSEFDVTSVQPGPEETSVKNAPGQDVISRRAYEIYLERGGLPGHEVEDWLQAESEIGKAGFSIGATKDAQQQA